MAFLASQRAQARVRVFMLVVVACSLVGCSKGNGLRSGTPDAIGYACASGTLPGCQCATPDGADTMVVDSAIESDGATRMDTTPDSPDSRVADSAAESDGAAGIDTAGALSCDDLSVAALDGVRRFIDDACQSDEDCTTIFIGNKCVVGCWLTTNFSSAPEVEDEVDYLCQPFFAQKCQAPQLPCYSVHAPSCVAGICQTGFGGH